MAGAEEYIKRLKEEILPKFTDIIAFFVEEYRNKPIAEFRLLVDTVSLEASREFVAMLGLPSLDKAGKTLALDFALNLVSALNSALPLDYPYIVAIIFSENASRPFIGIMQRKIIPGSNELLNSGVVPVLNLRKPPEGSDGETNGIKITDVEYFGGPNDPRDLEKML
jgi:hypothetical protein